MFRVNRTINESFPRVTERSLAEARPRKRSSPATPSSPTTKDLNLIGHQITTALPTLSARLSLVHLRISTVHLRTVNLPIISQPLSTNSCGWSVPRFQRALTLISTKAPAQVVGASAVSSLVSLSTTSCAEDSQFLVSRKQIPGAVLASWENLEPTGDCSGACSPISDRLRCHLTEQ